METPDYAAMLAQVREAQEVLHTHEAQLRDQQNRQVVIEVSSMTDTFWLVVARDWLRQHRDYNDRYFQEFHRRSGRSLQELESLVDSLAWAVLDVRQETK